LLPTVSKQYPYTQDKSVINISTMIIDITFN